MASSSERIRDEWLVLQAQTGHPAALAALIKRWSGPMAAAARALAARGEDEDALQEAWLAIARGLSRLDDPARFPAWSHRILANKCADTLRKRGRRRRTLDALAASQREPWTLDPCCEADEFGRALAALPSELRAVLTLFYSSELDVRTIAGVLSIPAGTVKSRLHSARERLRAVLEPNADECDLVGGANEGSPA